MSEDFVGRNDGRREPGRLAAWYCAALSPRHFWTDEASILRGIGFQLPLSLVDLQGAIYDGLTFQKVTRNG